MKNRKDLYMKQSIYCSATRSQSQQDAHKRQSTKESSVICDSKAGPQSLTPLSCAHVAEQVC